MKFKRPEYLEDTQPLMTSPNYRVRFLGEYFQTLIRHDKLKSFLDRIELHDRFDAYPQQKHDCPFELLREQQKIMEQYLHVLELRAIIEEIDLTKSEYVFQDETPVGRTEQ